MVKNRFILGGMIAGLAAFGALAEPSDAPVDSTLSTSSPQIARPVSRAEIADPQPEVVPARFARMRPVARPVRTNRPLVRVVAGSPPMRPPLRPEFLPEALWDFRHDGALWTRAAMSAIATHGNGLEQIVPRDIDTWCPGYAGNSEDQRRAFWVGMMSALAEHESTWRPTAVGGGGQWFGLLQIYPDTARRYGCRARTGAALQDPEDNLSCAVRIMATTVRRDRAVAVHDGRWRGVAADWGPMTDRGKSAEMAAWTRAQPYCQVVSGPRNSLRPRARPADLTREPPIVMASNEGG